jgi:hypothetical protein
VLDLVNQFGPRPVREDYQPVHGAFAVSDRYMAARELRHFYAISVVGAAGALSPGRGENVIISVIRADGTHIFLPGKREQAVLPMGRAQRVPSH